MPAAGASASGLRFGASVPGNQSAEKRGNWTKVEFPKKSDTVSRFRQEPASFPKWPGTARTLPAVMATNRLADDRLVKVKAEVAASSPGPSLEPPGLPGTQEDVDRIIPRPLNAQVMQKAASGGGQKLGKPYRAVAAVTWTSSASAGPSAPVVTGPGKAGTSPIMPVSVAGPARQPEPPPATTFGPRPAPSLPVSPVAAAPAQPTAHLPAAPTTLAVPTAPAVKTAIPSRGPAQPHVQYLVARACEGLGKNLVVYMKNDGKLFIAVDVATQEAGAVLFQRLNAIPELGPLAIEFKATVTSARTR
jgi:hypothetical protein